MTLMDICKRKVKRYEICFFFNLVIDYQYHFQTNSSKYRSKESKESRGYTDFRPYNEANKDYRASSDKNENKISSIIIIYNHH